MGVHDFPLFRRYLMLSVADGKHLHHTRIVK